MTATFYVGDAIQVMNRLPEKSVDLILTSPPFLALRSYLPQDHPDKALEGGSQATPGEYIDWLLDVVEACARVLAPHGSLCFELGDTYSGSGGAGGDYAEGALRDGQPAFMGSARTAVGSRYGADPRDPGRSSRGTGGTAWPLAKSLSLIPETFRFAMVYGINPHTGRTTPPWRLRNVIRWVRPNPPVGALGDKFRPATSELMVFCKAKDRFFDLDAVREPHMTDDAISRPRVRGLKDEGYGGRASTNTGGNPSGAPPLDWWNIPLLDGDEETRYGPKHEPWVRKVRASGDKGDPNGGRDTLGPYAGNENPLGSPPLDWWNIPPGGYSGFTTWKTKVAVDPATYDGFAGDIQHTVSADCPEHGDQADPAARESHGGREGIESNRNLGNGDRPVQALTLDFVPIDQPPSLNPEDESSDSPGLPSIPAATRRSKPSRKTVPVPATSPLDTPSEETPSHTDDTSGSPSSGGPNLDSPENRNGEADPSSLGPETAADTDRISGQPSACTCSYFVEKANNTSHYAVWPPELLVKPIKAMCPEKVCRRCGEARRRIVGEAAYVLENGSTVARNTWTSGIAEGKGAHSDKPDRGHRFKSAPTLGFSDCGHDDYRPGLVLDPFAGSGTTLAVATGHGRDAIGIDLDERNYELALDRVGPLILERGTEPARRINS